MNIWFYIWLATFFVLSTGCVLLWRTMSILLEENVEIKKVLIRLYQYYQVFLSKLNSVDKFGGFAEHDDFGRFFTILRQSIKELKEYFSIVKLTEPKDGKKQDKKQ